MRYLSLFSGIGGLEHPAIPPLLLCEKDSACRELLKRQYREAVIAEDVADLARNPPAADIVVGGWPCQDLSSAGTLGGIEARRSGLFFDMLRVTKASGAHTFIGENVPNLLTINRGRDFQVVLDALAREGGFPFVAWRVLNARAFGLPQERRRLFIVASKERRRAEALHGQTPIYIAPQKTSEVASGFYWTGGKRSICFSHGYVPALKIGATDNKGRAPVAVLLGEKVRKLTATEFVRLQGFDPQPFSESAPSTILRMAGNAVPKPMGHFVMSSVELAAPFSMKHSGWGRITSSGMICDGLQLVVDHPSTVLATNLVDFIDLHSDDSLSPQAAAGLIVRSVRSQQSMPRELFDILLRLASDRSRKLRPSRGNSFEALDSMAGIAAYRESLLATSDYTDQENSSEEDDADSDDFDRGQRDE